MTFRYESEMTKLAEDWLKSQKLLTKREFETHWGICDLVGVSFNRENTAKRLSYKQQKPIGPPLRINILEKIPDQNSGRSIRISTVRKKISSYVSDQAFNKAIEKLVSDRFVVLLQRGTLQKLANWMPLQKRLVTIELKLSRTKEALMQAYNNLELTHESYVGLPMERALRIANGKKRQDFEENNVGLLGLSRSECAVIIPTNTKPRQHPTTSEIYCVERFWRTRLTGS